MDGYSTRLVDPDDPETFDAARALVREYLLDWYGGLGPAELREQDAALLLDMASAKTCPVAVALDASGTAVGASVLHLHDGLAELRAGWVRPEHRGRGLAAAMTDLLLARAAGMGIGQVLVVVASGGPLEEVLVRRGLAPAGPPPDGAPGFVRFDLPVTRHTRMTTNA